MRNLISVTVIFLSALLLISGCRRKEPVSPPSAGSREPTPPSASPTKPPQKNIDNAASEKQSAKWAEGKSMMGSIATAIRAWCAEKGEGYATPPADLAELGFATGDLSGTYFADADFDFTVGIPVTVPPTFTVTCTPGTRSNAPTNPTSYLLTGNVDGTTTWTP